MPGQGTFNLSEFFRQFGIKNPEPSVRESIQPVVNVGNFAGLTPQHRAPTGAFGGDQAGVVGEFTVWQVRSLGAGGSLLHQVSPGTATHHFIVGNPIAGLAIVPAAGFLSDQPCLSRVERGTVPVIPAAAGDSPSTPSANFVLWPGFREPFYVPPGQAFILFSAAAGLAINGTTFIVSDVPASEARP